MRRVLLFRTQPHFSSVFFHLNRQFTALEAVGLFQLSKRLTFKNIIFWQDLWKSRASHVRNLFPVSITREAVKNLSPCFVPWLWQSPPTLLCQWTLAVLLGYPTQGCPLGWRLGDKGGFGGHWRGSGREGTLDGSRVRPGRNVWAGLGRGKGHLGTLMALQHTGFSGGWMKMQDTIPL